MRTRAISGGHLRLQFRQFVAFLDRCRRAVDRRRLRRVRRWRREYNGATAAHRLARRGDSADSKVLPRARHQVGEQSLDRLSIFWQRDPVTPRAKAVNTGVKRAPAAKTGAHISASFGFPRRTAHSRTLAATCSRAPRAC